MADDQSVPLRPPPGMDRTSHLGRRISGIDVVLDADGDAVERAQGLPVAAAPVGGGRLLANGMRIEMRPGTDGRLLLLDAGQAGLRDLESRDGAAGEVP